MLGIAQKGPKKPPQSTEMVVEHNTKSKKNHPETSIWYGLVWYLSFTRLGSTWYLYHLLCLHYIWKSYPFNCNQAFFQNRIWDSTFARYGFDSLKYRFFIWTKQLKAETPKIWIDFLWFQPVFTVFKYAFVTEVFLQTGHDWTHCTVFWRIFQAHENLAVEETVGVGKTRALFLHHQHSCTLPSGRLT